MQWQILIYAYALALTFGTSVVLTACMRRVAIRHNLLDRPGAHKKHEEPVPLMGGVAIVASFFLVALTHIAVFRVARWLGAPGLEQGVLDFLGEGTEIKVAGILAGALTVFILGVVDDFKALSPMPKLFGQIGAALMLVASGLRIEAFVLSNFWLSALVTVFWVVMLTNSLNFLDNMDGLCGGVSVIAALSFFLAVHPDETLVRLILMVFAGAVGGFLYHNLAPARIYMGDAGAMFSGFLLATIGLLGTFHSESTESPIAVAAPLFALAVPLFDTITVVFIRWRAGVPIMKGDHRHFSHRLVRLGMTRSQAVEFIFLVAAVVGLGGALLSQLSAYGTGIIIAQTVGVFLLIVLLMNAGRKKNGESSDGEAPQRKD